MCLAVEPVNNDANIIWDKLWFCKEVLCYRLAKGGPRTLLLLRIFTLTVHLMILLYYNITLSVYRCFGTFHLWMLLKKKTY